MPDARVVSLSGAPLDSVADDELLPRLKRLVVQIESGEIVPIDWYLIFSSESKDERGKVESHSLDSGLTLCAAVYLLESEKLRLMAMAGVLGRRD